jgi:hypothetical protein
MAEDEILLQKRDALKVKRSHKGLVPGIQKRIALNKQRKTVSTDTMGIFLRERKESPLSQMSER